MDGYQTIFSTSNIIELDMVEQTLINNGIKVFVKGGKALEVASIEITGAPGAFIMVPVDDVEKARSILIEAKLDGKPSAESDNFHKNVMLGFGLLFFLLACYLIYIFVFE